MQQQTTTPPPLVLAAPPRPPSSLLLFCVLLLYTANRAVGKVRATQTMLHSNTLREEKRQKYTSIPIYL